MNHFLQSKSQSKVICTSLKEMEHTNNNNNNEESDNNVEDDKEKIEYSTNKSGLITSLILLCLFTLLMLNYENEVAKYEHTRNNGFELESAFREDTKKDEKDWIAKREVEYNLRRLTLQNACAKFEHRRFRYRRPSRETFRANSRLKIAMCPNAKVGTTFWLAHFVLWSNFFDENRKKSLLQSQWELRNAGSRVLRPSRNLQFYYDIINHKNVLTFSFVRHPFERLASTFRDKIARGTNIAYAKMSHDLKEKSKINNETLFESFLKYIIAKPHYNKHWWPFNYRCLYCNVHYDIIGKMETFEEDKQYIFLKIGANATTNVIVKKMKNPSKILEKKGFSGKELFAKVSNSTRFKILDIYKDDFLLFNYSSDEYFI